MCKVDAEKFDIATAMFADVQDMIFSYVPWAQDRHDIARAMAEARWALQQAYGASGYPQRASVEANKEKRRGVQ